MKKAVIEVGVQKAQDTERLHKEYMTEDSHYYGFEPNYKMHDTINRVTFNLENITIDKRAVDIQDRKADFFIGFVTKNQPVENDAGISSLHRLNDDLEPMYQHWKFKHDLDETFTVDCVRMDTFIKENDIDEITYLHCDAQGNDINVLRSFGSQIYKLKAGKVEASNEGFLYRYEENSLQNCIDYLKSNEFEIVSVENNDPKGFEVNIEFKKL